MGLNSISVVQEICGHILVKVSGYSAFKYVLKMWRIDIFICHKCGKRENIVGHRWSSQTLGGVVILTNL
jgi:hypothetical protein